MKLNKTKNNNKGKVHPSPSSSSSSSSSSSDPVSNLNNLLPPTILTLISILSLQDKQVLSYMITHSPNNGKKTTYHKITPSFDCGCFECYTTYWFLWDSSPNRDLIHHAIEAFEEHLALSELHKPTLKSNPRRVKNNKASQPDEGSRSPCLATVAEVADEVEERESGGGGDVEERESGVHEKRMSQQQQHKGLARKVLPDVIGLFNSRLWNLWTPNV